MWIGRTLSSAQNRSIHSTRDSRGKSEAGHGVFAPARVRPLTLILGFLALICLYSLIPAAAVRADAGCNLYADPAGDDAHTGQEATGTLTTGPKKSPVALLNALAPGQTGCLTDGATFRLAKTESTKIKAEGTTAQPETLRPATLGSRATISMQTTQLEIEFGAHDVILKDLNIRRDEPEVGAGHGSLFDLNGDRVTLDGLDLTYGDNICLDVGGDPREKIKNAEGKWVPNPFFTTDPTQDLVIRNSRIHGCGSTYGGPHFIGDSGVHGIYMEYLRDGPDADPYSATLEDNFIYNNDTRGLQLYPDVDNALIQFNVLDGNGANLNIGSDREENKIYSEHNIVTNNIITDSRLDGAPPNTGGFIGDTSEVLGNLPQVGNFDNHVDENCIGSTTTQLKAEEPAPSIYGGFGYTHLNNKENFDPKYKNKAAGDFTIPANSPCAGKGPRQAGNPTCDGRPATISTPPYTGTPGEDVIVGSPGNDVIEGGGGNDFICGGGGDDVIRGGEGFDTLSGGPGNDTLDGQAGGDGVEYGESATPVTVDLQAGTATGEGNDTLVSISQAYGSQFADTLRGSEANPAPPNEEVLYGAGGNDLLDGRAGTDTLTGGEGNDELVGGPGQDILNGNGGSDAMKAKDGEKDEINCGAGVDSVEADVGVDKVAADCETTPPPPPPTVTKIKPATGPVTGGTKVTITGTNFTGATSVRFGAFEEGTEVTVTSATSLTVVSPATEEAHIGNVTVTTPGGTSAVTAKDRYKYTPTITEVQPNHGPAAGSTYVEIHGNGFSIYKPTTFKFGTAAATTIECPFSWICTAYTPAHTVGRVDVKATVENLTSVKKPADRFTYQ